MVRWCVWHLEVWWHESVIDDNNDAGLLVSNLSNGSDVHDLHQRICRCLNPNKLSHKHTHSTQYIATVIITRLLKVIWKHATSHSPYMLHCTAHSHQNFVHYYGGIWNQSTCFWGRPDPPPQMASRSSQPFFRIHGHYHTNAQKDRPTVGLGVNQNPLRWLMVHAANNNNIKCYVRWSTIQTIKNIQRKRCTEIGRNSQT